MELLPSVALLIMMHPNRQPKPLPGGTPPTLIGKTADGLDIRRNLLNNSPGGTPPTLNKKTSEDSIKSKALRGEGGPLLKYTSPYGSTDA